ncbi:MAG: CRISPR-associated endonuclease Cas2 [Thalassobaculum sp.]|uniref:CRISPR-associated endonuclease Cas2 n=1 Tax=Thalassobaculum sp. TaxID=2022740 RepID=UPI0032EC5C48
MAGVEMLTIFTYDITDDRRRRRAARILEGTLVRVQESVFEGRLTRSGARQLIGAVEAALDRDDSLRVYAVAADGLDRCHQRGGAPIMTDEDYWLL